MIFVSYARRDERFVNQLIAALEPYHVDSWLDRHSIPGGTHWEAEISKAIKACSAVVVVLSAAAGESGHVATELSLARDYNRPIVPIVHGPWERSEPTEHIHRLNFLLSGRQFIDFSTVGFDRGIEDLLKAISVAPVQRPKPSGRRRLSWRAVTVGGLALILAAAGAVQVFRTFRLSTGSGHTLTGC